jgi:hypothetical protein
LRPAAWQIVAGASVCGVAFFANFCGISLYDEEVASNAAKASVLLLRRKGTAPHRGGPLVFIQGAKA